MSDSLVKFFEAPLTRSLAGAEEFLNESEIALFKDVLHYDEEVLPVIQKMYLWGKLDEALISAPFLVMRESGKMKPYMEVLMEKHELIVSIITLLHRVKVDGETKEEFGRFIDDFTRPSFGALDGKTRAFLEEHMRVQYCILKVYELTIAYMKYSEDCKEDVMAQVARVSNLDSQCSEEYERCLESFLAEEQLGPVEEKFLAMRYLNPFLIEALASKTQGRIYNGEFGACMIREFEAQVEFFRGAMRASVEKGAMHEADTSRLLMITYDFMCGLVAIKIKRSFTQVKHASRSLSESDLALFEDIFREHSQEAIRKFFAAYNGAEKDKLARLLLAHYEAVGERPKVDVAMEEMLTSVKSVGCEGLCCEGIDPSAEAEEHSCCGHSHNDHNHHGHDEHNHHGHGHDEHDEEEECEEECEHHHHEHHHEHDGGCCDHEHDEHDGEGCCDHDDGHNGEHGHGKPTAFDDLEVLISTLKEITLLK